MKKTTSLLQVLWIIAFAAILGGCATTEGPPAPNATYVVVKPSTTLIKDCVLITAPPDQAEYAKAPPAKKEQLLHDYAQSLQQNDFKQCNSRWAILRKWYDDQAAVYANQSGTPQIVPAPPLPASGPSK